MDKFTLNEDMSGQMHVKERHSTHHLPLLLDFLTHLRIRQMDCMAPERQFYRTLRVPVPSGY